MHTRRQGNGLEGKERRSRLGLTLPQRLWFWPDGVGSMLTVASLANCKENLQAKHN